MKPQDEKSLFITSEEWIVEATRLVIQTFAADQEFDLRSLLKSWGNSTYTNKCNLNCLSCPFFKFLSNLYLNYFKTDIGLSYIGFPWRYIPENNHVKALMSD